MNELSKIKLHPLSPTLVSRLSDINRNAPDPVYATEEAMGLIETIFLQGIDPKQIKVANKRTRFERVGDYLREIEGAAIVRVAEILTMASAGERWERIFGGKGFVFVQWMASVFPVLTPAREKMEQFRGEMRASKALDRLDAIADKEEMDGANVKACELLLRAHHPAFGKPTEEKVGSDRTIVVVNMAGIFGAEAVDASRKERRDVVDVAVRGGEDRRSMAAKSSAGVLDDGE